MMPRGRRRAVGSASRFIIVLLPAQGARRQWRRWRGAAAL